MRSFRVPSWVCLATALSAGLLLPASALAQQVALDRFEPAPAGDRMFGVESPYALGEGVPHVALILDYAHNPYTLRHGPGLTDVQAVVSDQMFLHVNISVAILNRLNLNFSVPAAVMQDGGDPTVGTTTTTISSPHDAAFGDLRFGARVRIYGEYDDPFQLGVSGYVWAPTGAGNLYVSDGKTRGAASLVLGGHVPILNWSFAAGFQFRPTQTLQIDPTAAPFTQGTNMQIGGGVGFLFADGKAQIGPEVKGSFLTAGSNSRTTNAELTIAARYRLFDDFEIGLGAGPGLTAGFGTPDIRVLGMLAFSPQMKPPPPPDRDGDGVPDAEDACPDLAAPRTANPAKPGCPAPADRDGDGIPDEVDACPDVPGVASTDPSKNGCPMDRDGDGIPDAKDACPDQPGPPAAAPARNGCPLPRDSDGDGIPDAEDACPTIPGIKSTDPRQNGCPGDRDGDGIRDDLDACPDVPGVPSRDPRKNGCPRARMSDKGIDILEQVEFEVGTAKIQAVSHALIEEVAAILEHHADITRVEVQGHTDNDGNRVANRVLSQQRADAVKKALVALGVDQKRLLTKGYGPDKPLVDNTTAEGRAKNRRVQFVILERAAAKPAEPGKAPVAPRPALPKPPARPRRRSERGHEHFPKRFPRDPTRPLVLAHRRGAALRRAFVRPAGPAPGRAGRGRPAAPGGPAPVAGAATAVAGVSPTYVGKADFKNDPRPDGWSPAVSLGITAAFANNSGVVGQSDGTSFSFGMKGDAALNYNRGLHEWRNTLGVVASVTRTPVITDFVKTSDNLNLDSIYLFHALPWFGPFARFSLHTSMFRGTDVRPTAVNYFITQADGTKSLVANSTSLTLSDPFRPLTFKETIGLFAQPYVSVPASFELRLGAGAQEVLADGQLAVTGQHRCRPGDDDQRCRDSGDAGERLRSFHGPSSPTPTSSARSWPRRRGAPSSTRRSPTRSTPTS